MDLTGDCISLVEKQERGLLIEQYLEQSPDTVSEVSGANQLPDCGRADHGGEPGDILVLRQHISERGGSPAAAGCERDFLDLRGYLCLFYKPTVCLLQSGAKPD